MLRQTQCIILHLKWCTVENMINKCNQGLSIGLNMDFPVQVWKRKYCNCFIMFFLPNIIQFLYKMKWYGNVEEIVLCFYFYLCLPFPSLCFIVFCAYKKVCKGTRPTVQTNESNSISVRMLSLSSLKPLISSTRIYFSSYMHHCV